MAEEFFRGGFSSGFFVTGEVLPRLKYTLTINNNISELGVPQGFDTRNMLFGGGLRWQPTTGEFGDRGGFGDFEYHKHLATQFGFDGAQSREGRYAPLGDPPLNTQIKLSDGDNPFLESALANSVTVSTLSYREIAADAGAKYRGFSFQSEFYWRTLNDFVADNRAVEFDFRSRVHGGGRIHGRPEDAERVRDRRIRARSVPAVSLGGRRWCRLLPVTYAELAARSSRRARRPKSGHSSFGYYLAGLTGTIISLGTDVLF